MNTPDPNHWTSWTDTPPPCSHSEPGVAEAMALAKAGVASASARDALFNDIWDMRSTAEKNALIDAFAHELAEQIRVKAGGLIDEAAPRTTPSDPKYDKAAGAVLAADLIDPAVKGAPR